MGSSYVEERDGGYWIRGTRVSLDSIVYSFLEGHSPESIAQAFPVLDLEQIYGAITYYLGNRSKVDAYLERSRQEYETARRAERAADPAFYQKLAEARKQLLVRK